jgi:protein O-GlcNAc transferase
LPVLTCPGQAFAGRYAASLLKAVELPELIVSSPVEYEDLAVSLAEDSAQLASIRRKLAENRLTSRLFDTPRFTKSLEFAYTQIFQRSLAGLPPWHIYPEF